MGRRALRLQAGVDAAIGLFVAGSCLRAVETAGELIAFRALQARAGVVMVLPIGVGSPPSRSSATFVLFAAWMLLIGLLRGTALASHGA